jgi:hypothetical protein
MTMMKRLELLTMFGRTDLNRTGSVLLFRASVADQLMAVLGHVLPPALPLRFRRLGAISGRRIKTWIIEDDTGEMVKAKLSEEDLRLPIASICNHEYLVQRI